MANVKRIFVEKRVGLDIEAQRLLADLNMNLRIPGLENIRILNRYDILGVSEAEYLEAKYTIFAEPPVDIVYEDSVELQTTDRAFAVEYLPGQYDQRADSAAQCIQILTGRERPTIFSARVIVLQGTVSDADLARVKTYFINPVDSREASLDKPENLQLQANYPPNVEILNGFVDKDSAQLAHLHKQMGLAMSVEDLEFCQTYFRAEERRNPTVTEIKVIDTYWSDHCRHTTFLTDIAAVDFAEGEFIEPIKLAYREYLALRKEVHGKRDEDICLMDIATLAMKGLKLKGGLKDLDESDEINACSIVVQVDVDGQYEEWLVMFKNETHNHPTEIEPFGGAATCLGGAIRDPLSGRSFVYQAMRVTGSGDPRAEVEDTLPGKLPQRIITSRAADGYSSYGNQIGLATGQVAEIYDPGFVAKRMEIGAVIGAAPRKQVVRKAPRAGDLVVLVGGRTGRDGCGGATGSSKEHDRESLIACGAEVQKGNPPEERKIQRLFRNPAVSTLIKKCNDFGAGGVSVAIGELAEGLKIDLDAVPKKYEGLDGTELAISESQERMAVVLEEANVTRFLNYAREENLEATVVARVTGDRRLKMVWRQQTVVDLARDFLDTNGVKQRTRVMVEAPREAASVFRSVPNAVSELLPDTKQAWLANLQDLNVCAKQGLVEKFDSTIGAATVLMPLGGKYQLTPVEGMVAKLPVQNGETNTATAMTFGYNPKLAKWSPFHGALYAVLEAVTKIVCLGGDYRSVRLTLQEYFEKLGKDPVKWGKPFSALLGAFYAQTKLGIAAIGGKDSMSGTFLELTVPPTLVAFAVNVLDARRVVSQEFKHFGSKIVLIKCKRDQNEIPDFQTLKRNFQIITGLINEGKVLASHSVKIGGVAAALSEMAFGNQIGLALRDDCEPFNLFAPDYGSVILELDPSLDLKEIFAGIDYELLGYTCAKAEITVNKTQIPLHEALLAWESPLESVFPAQVEPVKLTCTISASTRNSQRSRVKIAKPRIFIPIFPGTNCEYDSTRAFEKAGGIVKNLVIKNLSPAGVEESIQAMVEGINEAQIIMLPGGFSAGDEPDGSGKFIATMFRNPKVKEAVNELLYGRDGLMLGICNGFQALIKLGLVPYGEIKDLEPEAPTLTVNKIGRHISRMVQTKVVSVLSPWFSQVELGEIHTIPVSHGEGRFVVGQEILAKLIASGQVATQYVDFAGDPSGDVNYNPNGSVESIEGITSPDGRILGKMGHSERYGNNICTNVPGHKLQPIFAGGVNYFS